MKILIIGEFSGFAKHLKNGFLQLGHDVTIVQTGDGFKQLSNHDDIVYRNRTWMIGKHPLHGSNRILAIFTNLRLHKEINNRCPKPDIIIVINYVFLRKNFTTVGVSRGFINASLKKGAKLIVSACGGDPSFTYTYPELCKIIKYRTVDENDKRFVFLLKKSSVVIPTIYHYYYAITNYCKNKGLASANITKPIPLPITIEPLSMMPSCVSRKIVIFHGIIRPIAKGTPYIMQAMERIQNEYPDKVECICKGGMPYSEYVTMFNRVDILIDQVYGNGWGMNAILGAMKGKCILTATGKENENYMNIPKIPFVKIEADSEQIYRTLKDLVLNPAQIDILKNECRTFAMTYCDSKIIAQRYLDLI